MQKTTKRINGLDFLKFIAALMITNYHFRPLYEGHNIGFATFGVHGNALFFFVSGFFLYNIFSKNQSQNTSFILFSIWYKNKINRLWPSIIVWPIIASLIYNKEINWQDFLIGGGYWFIRCFLISFPIIYFIMKYYSNYLYYFLIASILLTFLLVISHDKVTGSIYHNNLFHYFCYFSTMLFGVIVGVNKDTIKNKSLIKDLLLLIISFVTYFIIMHFGKDKMNAWYYIQLLDIVPLILFLYYAYKVSCYKWCDKVASTKIWYVIYFIASLTLEIYIVQFDIITGRFNMLYPFNTIVVFSIILFAAYCLRVCTNFFVQTMNKEKWDWKKMITI